MSAPVSSKTSPSRIHYAWIVVAVTFATSVITAGTLGISGILLLPLQQEFGWNASDVSSAFGIRLALFGLLGPFTATLMNRFGVRRSSAYGDHSASSLAWSGRCSRPRSGSSSSSGDCLRAWESASRPWSSVRLWQRGGSSSAGDS
jgi:hypothetical protein